MVLHSQEMPGTGPNWDQDPVFPFSRRLTLGCPGLLEVQSLTADATDPRLQISRDVAEKLLASLQ